MRKQTGMILAYYAKGGPKHWHFAARMIWGTLTRAARTLPQTISYLAYFIHLREYADRVVAKEYRFDYALTGVNFESSNMFGEGGSIDMLQREAAKS